MLKAIEVLEYFKADQMVNRLTPFDVSFYDEAIEEIKQYEQKFRDKEFKYRTECQNILSAERIEADKIDSVNNGGKTDYYQLSSAPFPINDFDDFAEWRNLNGNQFNIGKVAWTFSVGRHSGTTYIRDLNKIIHYAQREILRVSRENKD